MACSVQLACSVTSVGMFSWCCLSRNRRKADRVNWILFPRHVSAGMITVGDDCVDDNDTAEKQHKKGVNLLGNFGVLVPGRSLLSPVCDFYGLGGKLI